MAEWWTYELSDFLLFSHRVYIRLFELHNTAVWPAQIVTIIMGAAILAGVMWPIRWAGRLVPVALGVLWLWVAWSFFQQRYATINWAAVYVVPAFALEGCALIALGLSRALDLRASARRRSHLMRGAGAAVLALCLFVYPVLAPLLGRTLAAADVFGITPDATAVGTLAVLIAAHGWGRWGLAVIPVCWIVISGLTLWTLGAAEAFVAPAAAIACIGAMAWRGWPTRGA